MRWICKLALVIGLTAPIPAFADDAAPPPAAAQLDAGAPAIAVEKPAGIATSPGADVTHDQVADPLQHPAQVLGQLEAEKDRSGWFALAILVLYIVAAVIMRLAGHVGWFAKGRRLALLTGGAGLLGSCVDKIAAGGTTQAVMTALAVGVALLVVPLHPNTADGSATEDGLVTGKQPSIPGAVVKKVAAASIVLAMVGCAGHQTALNLALSTADGAAAAFTQYDKQHQDELLAQSKTPDEWKSAIASYRLKQQAALDGFVLAYQAIATAALTSSDVNVTTAIADVEAVVKLLQDLGVKVPGAPSSTATPTTGGK
jgi:hypothetical protein